MSWKRKHKCVVFSKWKKDIFCGCLQCSQTAEGVFTLSFQKSLLQAMTKYGKNDQKIKIPKPNHKLFRKLQIVEVGTCNRNGQWPCLAQFLSISCLPSQLMSARCPGSYWETFSSRHLRTKEPGTDPSAGGHLSTGFTSSFHRWENRGPSEGMSDMPQTPQPAMAEPDPQAGFYLAVSQSPEMLQGRLGLLGSQDREPSVYRQQTVVTRGKGIGGARNG